MPEGKAFIILNNWTQTVLVRYKRLSRKACLEALGLLSGVIVIGLKGYPFSPFPAFQSPFLFTLLQGQDPFKCSTSCQFSLFWIGNTKFNFFNDLVKCKAQLKQPVILANIGVGKKM